MHNNIEEAKTISDIEKAKGIVLLKWFLPAWGINAVLFVSSIFAMDYTLSISHWSAPSWANMAICWGFTKAILSILVLVAALKSATGCKF